ncbi:XRE family transcriptional regulator [Dactylosporangium sp. CS-047395]|uniref:XRE family transcriptional regulator n=1 Tax=Dactylosporangium sp. CS-047395 TaxID=3239936 RepID=UPI003D905922
MLRTGLDSAALAAQVGVDAKTVDRWLSGRVPHRRSRLAVAECLGEEEGALWPAARPDQAAGAPALSEVVGAYAHRADVPHDLWVALLAGARQRIDLLGYAYPFVLELRPDAGRLIATKAAQGVAVRMGFADPDCAHVAERDALEQLNGSLPGRIRNALSFLGDLVDVDNISIGLHQVHLYSSIFRFDDQMIVTPYLYRARGYQHPALHLRKLSEHGIFSSYEEQFGEIWATVRPLEATTV